jgi:hypothetical protein
VTIIQSITLLLNAPIDPSAVEKPPVAMVVIAWHMASKGLIPAVHSAAAHIRVKAPYVMVIQAAVGPALGNNFLEWSDISIRKSCIPPTPKRGRTAIAMTIMPIPPSHCSSARQSNIPRAVSSRLAITVDPVVVRPDIASKNAPDIPISGIDSNIGRLANAAITIQLNVVKTNASFTPIANCLLLEPSARLIPTNRLAAAEIRNCGQTIPPSAASAMAGMVIDTDRITKRRPVTKKVDRILVTEHRSVKAALIYGLCSRHLYV